MITTIWTVYPLYSALADRLMFKTRLKYYHWVGMLCMIACSCAISGQGIINQMKALHTEIVVFQKVPTWIPVLFGLLTPVTFTVVAIITKHLTSPEVGFQATQLAFSCYTISNGLTFTSRY
jgi:drug/metabolite transporter (DMT)-like permease